MDISAINPNSALPAAVPAIPADKAAENRAVVKAVKAINRSELLGQENEMTLQVDQRTHKLLVRMVNRRTREVVAQYPPEYVLRLAEGVK